jgi:hypothetical protein
VLLPSAAACGKRRCCLDTALLQALAMLGAVGWFGLNGLLWYAKPNDLVWLADQWYWA